LKNSIVIEVEEIPTNLSSCVCNFPQLLYVFHVCPFPLGFIKHELLFFFFSFLIDELNDGSFENACSLSTDVPEDMHCFLQNIL